MNLELDFVNIIDAPDCAIMVNHVELYRGPTQPHYRFKADTLPGPVLIEIEHYNKRPEDTHVVDGIIVRDRSFELNRICIDGYDLEDLIWLSEFRANDGAVYASCLFFGPNGRFRLDCSDPILPWILEQRHLKTGMDPDWRQDYQYYQQACNLLSQISSK